MTVLRLILGDQLNAAHPWFRLPPSPSHLYVLAEVRSETDYVRHHAQKVLAIFAAMRRFAGALRAAGHRVLYIPISDPRSRGTLVATLAPLFRDCQITAFERMEADEYRVEQHLTEEVGLLCSRLGISVSVTGSHHFLCDRSDSAAAFSRTVPRLETFYRGLRRRTGLLMTAEGTPQGGRWNYDPENRERWPGSPPVRDWPRFATDLSDLWAEIRAAGVVTFGDPCAEAFPWPLTRQQARHVLTHFIDTALPHFGRFQDAMSRHSETLFHSGLSFALNTKMLHPWEALTAAEQTWASGRVPLASAEGFIRQILGWREYVRAVYWARMPPYATLNALGATRPLPVWFWTGETAMTCLRTTIRQSLRTGYAHHIQRLMVTGAFALMAGCDPDAVDEWYLGIYVDAFDWVQRPNTRGMSQYADGGIVGSKPYCGSAAYISRQSDYCQSCPYDAKRRHGEGACPFNSLYWHFHHRHAAVLARNPRLSMVYKSWSRMAEPERSATLAHADTLLSRLDDL